MEHGHEKKSSYPTAYRRHSERPDAGTSEVTLHFYNQIPRKGMTR